RGHAPRLRADLRRRRRGRRDRSLGLTRVARALSPLGGRGGAAPGDGAVCDRGALRLLHRARAEDPRPLTFALRARGNRIPVTPEPPTVPGPEPEPVPSPSIPEPVPSP